jgi:hypothetical protein
MSNVKTISFDSIGYACKDISNEDFFNTLLQYNKKIINIDEVNERIFFYENDEDTVISMLTNEFNISGEYMADILAVEIDLEDYLDWKDGGEWFEIGKTCFDKTDCIANVQENLSIYEDRIMNSDHISQEIELIIKEQAPIVYKEKVEQMQKQLESLMKCNFEWQ